MEFIPATFHANQITAATHIMEVFLAGLIMYAIAWAEVQSGKTGTYQYIAREMLRRRIVERVYILCGSNETILRNQCIRDTLDYNGDNFSVDADGNQHGKFQVLFRQDFKRARMEIANSLIVVDESHLDQTQGQEMDKFLSRHGLSLDGTRPSMRETNTFIISVDATPYAEISAYLKNKSYPKHLERIEPGEGYTGIQDFMFTGRVAKTWKFTTTSGEANLGTILNSMNRKWILMRINSDKDTKLATLKRLCDARGFRILHFNSDKTEVAIRRHDDSTEMLPCLEDEPEVTTIVVIQGRLRAGKVVPKNHIGFVWEDAQTSKTDSIVQGLFGRMCGYYTTDSPKPLIFLPAATLKENEDRVVKGNELMRHIMGPDVLPMKGMNLLPGRLAKAASHGRTQCPPFLLTPEMFGDDLEYFDHDSGRTERHIKQLCLEKLRANLEPVLAQHTTLSDAQRTEIRTRIESIPVESTHIRNFQGASQIAYYTAIRAAYASHTTPSEHISDCPFVTFGVTYNNYTAPHAVRGEVYCILYTEASGWITAVHKDSRIPSDNGKSVFTIHDTAIHDEAVAVNALAMPHEALVSPANLETYLRNHFRLWNENALHAVYGIAPVMDSCIQAYEDRFVFSKRAFHHTSTSANDIERMIPRLNEEFGIRIKVNYCRPGAMHFGVKKIEWVRA
jgi:ElaB/YqjD/DUF883 family membrane-anchored ribosome-binding protein